MPQASDANVFRCIQLEPQCLEEDSRFLKPKPSMIVNAQVPTSFSRRASPSSCGPQAYASRAPSNPPPPPELGENLPQPQVELQGGAAGPPEMGQNGAKSPPPMKWCPQLACHLRVAQTKRPLGERRALMISVKNGGLHLPN